MLLDITVDTSDIDEAIAQYLTALSPPSIGAWLKGPMVEWLQLRMTERFDNEGDSAVGEWLDLAPKTQEIRAALGFPAEHPINERTGEMRSFLETNEGLLWANGMVMSFPDRTPGDLRWALLGAQGALDHQPARRVLAMDTTDMAQALVSLNEWIERMVGL